MILRPKPVETLVHDALSPNKRFWFFSTGTRIAPFVLRLCESETYERFDQVILTHTCRKVADLKFGEEVITETLRDPLVGEDAK